ncbi:MAG: V-type ATP synthase subunit I [Candidatus Cryptobacteroides sp.]
MITKMSKYSFILFNEDKESFLEQLQELGVVDICRSHKAIDEKSLQIMEQIKEIKDDISCIQKGNDEHLRELANRKQALEKEIRNLKVWGEFDSKAISDLASQGLELSFYSVASKKYDSKWEEDFAIQKIEDDGSQCYFVIVNAQNFPIKPLPVPSRSAADAQAELSALEKEMESHAQALKARSNEIPQLEAQIADLRSSLDLYLASLKAEEAVEQRLCCFEAFAPVDTDTEVEKALEKSCAYWWKEEATKDDNPPIKLKNNKFSKLFEGLTGMYGMPVYDEFDPTPILSIFFLLFFAMCMGDAGYGIILIFVGIALNKGWLKIGMFKGMGSIISVLGIATTVVGLFLGTFFGISLPDQNWVPQGLKNCMLTGKVMGYDLQMVLALGIGIFHICLAMIVKTICYIKRFGLKQNLSTIGWTLLIVGCVVVIALALLKWVPMNTAKILIIGIAAVSVLGIFIFNKPGRNPLLNIGAGLWDTYNMATGILGDVLSYIRLYALGLAGGMLGGAFNDLGAMVLGTNPTWQWLPYVIILLFGHVLNLLMSCLGAFVHPLRLTFVEYFKNSGYEGKGLKYNPLKKEIINN